MTKQNKKFKRLNNVTSTRPTKKRNDNNSLYKQEVDNITCSAHTLKLSVIKGLEKAKSFTKRFKKLIEFFNSPKQNERLEEAQRELIARYQEQRADDTDNNNSTNLTQPNIQQEELGIQQGPLRILRTINDVKTRWGSSLASWKRL